MQFFYLDVKLDDLDDLISSFYECCFVFHVL